MAVEGPEGRGNGKLIEDFKIDTFTALVGKRLNVSLPTEVSFTFHVESVTALDPETSDRAIPKGRNPFSVILLGQDGIALPQGSYNFSHDSVGDFDMFVVPVERRGNRLVYEAIFN